MKTALSITAHESPATIVDQCLNNIIVGQYDYIAIHINRSSDLDIMQLQDIINTVPILCDKVFVNKVRISTDWVAPGLLHRAHIENFKLLKQVGSFDMFAMDGSNTMLLVPGLKQHFAQHAYGADSVSALHWGGGWESNLRSDILYSLAGEACKQSQIEGMFLRTRLFEDVCDWIGEYERLFNEKYPDEMSAPKVPREEYIFATALDQLGYPPSGTSYILLRQGSALGWSTFDESSNVTGWDSLMPTISGWGWLPFEIERSLKSEKLYPLFWSIYGHHIPPIPEISVFKAGKFGIKRVLRGAHEPHRKMIGEHFGYRDHTLAVAEQWGAG